MGGEQGRLDPSKKASQTRQQVSSQVSHPDQAKGGRKQLGEEMRAGSSRTIQQKLPNFYGVVHGPGPRGDPQEDESVILAASALPLLWSKTLALEASVIMHSSY